ncbi:MAG: glycoside hydrolase family 13 protein [Clostridia bacterium]|nr:glycoside hydrolase family 13 protein [Clostridia bacterium]
MLLRSPIAAQLPTITKTVKGKDASAKGAFFRRDVLTLTARVPRALGAAAVVLRIAPDGGDDTDRAFTFVRTDRGVDTYCLTLSLAELCGEGESGLFYYEYLFVRGAETLFTDTVDNVTFSLLPHSAGRFRLLISSDDFVTPAWFQGRTMYHIFVDRFAPRGGTRRPNAVYHEHWDEEIEQFGAYPGAPVANNEFFGGTLWGILDKLDYLQSLGVGVLYLSPIFRAASNHKYDTGDYGEVDAQFGGREALEALLAECKRRDIGVMLDGVFNHTGDDSRYFNRRGNYSTVGAYESRESPFADWYYFKDFPDSYECWWNIEILPKLNLSNPDLHRYLVGEGGVVDTYTKMGVRGWRLDVADELPNAFLDELRVRVKNNTDGNGVLLGEVWENAADKIAYGKRRRYFQGKQLDSVMNYPLRNALISFVRDGDAPALCATLRELWGSYPTAVCHSLMNILSTHDTERILTVLGGAPDDGTRTNAELREARLSDTERTLAEARLCMAAALQFTVFGVPSVFYGDEAGMEGYHDPFCRRPFPWGRENKRLLAFYRKLGNMRRTHSALADGEFRLLRSEPHALLFVRENESEQIFVAANRGTDAMTVHLPAKATELLTGKRGKGRVRVLPDEVQIWSVKRNV